MWRRRARLLGGYTGKLLRVDLSSRGIKVQGLEEDLLRKYIGGSGVGAKILYDGTGPETDPLGPDNLLIFMTGPLGGTRVPLSGRHEIVSKSPLTGIYGESDVGGTWGAELKKTGLDGVVIRGRADRPTYVWVNDSSVEIRVAEHLWELDTYDVDPALKKETDPKAVVTVIGQAGERLARISSIMTDGKDGRAAARCGLGAVMGSKRLKAIVVKGSQKVRVADEQSLAQSIKNLGPQIVKGGWSLNKYGTSGAAVTIEQLGDLPIKNWAQGRFEEGAKKISGQAMAASILSGKYYCMACIIGCGREVKITDGTYAPVDGGGPEYESIGMLGANNLVDDIQAVAKANELCNRYGIDVISTGAVIGFAFEAYQRGLLTSKDTGGMELRWGDPQTMVQLVHMIGRREGIGWLLGEGVKRAAEKIGGQAGEFAVHVKGLELPAHDPRAYNSVGLSYATSNRGACHLAATSHIFERVVTAPDLGYSEIQDRFGVEGKAEFVVKLQNLMCMFDSLKICKFVFFSGVKGTHALNWLNQVTGWNMGFDEFMKTGERIYNLKRLYNVRCGVTRKDDTLPPRILSLKRGMGGAAENLPPLGRMLDDYYVCRGWDEFGVPKAETLRELSLPQLPR